MTQSKKSNITRHPNVGAVKLSVAEPPSTIVKRGKNYVYFGDDNLYPEYLLNLYNESPTHGAIIDGKVRYSVGKGLISEDANLDLWLKRANKKETWNEVLFKLSLDYELFNSFAIEVVRNREGNAAGYYHLDTSRIRVDEEEQVYYYSDEWSKNGKVNFRPSIAKFVEFNPNLPNRVDEDGNAYRELLYYSEYRPNFKWYAYPPYQQIITSIGAEAEIANYDLNQWKFGFLGASMVNFYNGEPEDDDAKAEVLNNVRDTIGGSGGQNILVNFSDGKDYGAEITGVKGDNSAQEADMTSKRISSTIFTGHSVTSPMLFGVRESGTLGGRTEILEAYELFKETYISSRQKTLTNFIESVATINGLEGEIEIEELTPIQTEPNISEIAPYLPPNEVADYIRTKYGIEPKEPVTDEFSAMTEEQRKILDACDKTGFCKSKFRVIADKEPNFRNGKLQFEELDPLDLLIVSILEDNPDFSATEISKTAEENDYEASTEDIFIRLGKLIGLGWILKNGASYVLSRLGEKEAEKEELPKVEFMTVYSYELRPNAPTLRKKGETRADGSKVTQDGKSREFCVQLLAKNKMYTKEQILEMDNKLGTDVWMTRGGWLGVKNTDTALPFCRHWWKPSIVAVK